MEKQLAEVIETHPIVVIETRKLVSQTVLLVHTSAVVSSDGSEAVGSCN